MYVKRRNDNLAHNYIFEMWLLESSHYICGSNDFSAAQLC